MKATLNHHQTKKQRDQQILSYLAKFRVCSRNQLAKLCFNQNTNPVNVCNRTMKRLTMDGSVLQLPRSRDKTFLYTLNPSPIHHKSNKIDHHLKLVDFFISSGCPDNFIIEPILGKYEPDIFFRDKTGKTICVEIQLTPISHKKMQEKINGFVSEYQKNHDSKTIVLCSNYPYNKLTIPKHFRLIKQTIPNETLL